MVKVRLAKHDDMVKAIPSDSSFTDRTQRSA